MSWKKATFLVVAMSSVLFFKGCRKEGFSGNFDVSLGAIVPFSTLVVRKESHLSERGGFSVALLLLNLVLSAALLRSVVHHLPRTARHLTSTRFAGALLVSIVVFNSFLAYFRLWAYAVYYPTAWLAFGVAYTLHLGPPPDGIPDPRGAVSIAARLYFLVFVFALYGLTLGWIKFRRHPGRLTAQTPPRSDPSPPLPP